MEAETRKKVEETVIRILKKSNLKEDTERKIREAASEELNIDLSSRESKILVRSVVEDFLLASAKEDVVQEDPKQDERLAVEINKEAGDGVERVICKLSERKRVLVRDCKGRNTVCIREFYIQHGEEFPSAKGVSLSPRQWSAFRSSIPAMEEAIKKMETSLRLQSVINEETMPAPPVAAAGCVFVAELVPLEIKRFNGKNYQAWADQMELFLKQVNIAYVLTEPRPSIVKLEEDASNRNEGGAAAELKWVNDDYICHRNILSSLSDSLLSKYSSPKRESAKQLWEELKLAYFWEETYGTKMLQVKKYLEFEIVDNRSVSVRDQVEELNCLADSIVDSGVPVDEFFHVSVIMSKLPPSWKDFCFKFSMHNDLLSFRVLMDSIETAEEATQHDSKSNNPTATSSGGAVKAAEIGSSSSGLPPVVCFTCGKKGHIARNCRTRKTAKEHERKAA